MKPSSPSIPDWKIQIYRVENERRQQRILSVFHRIDGPGIVALGTQSGPDWFVVLECSSFADQIRAKHIVLTIDPGAERTYEYEVRPEDVRTRPLVHATHRRV
jgi:hypothetical protein